MSIAQKIEQIRQQPEHIRIRYVWATVAISMIFIVILWAISLKESVGRIQSGSQEVTNTIGEQSSSVSSSVKEGIDTAQKKLQEEIVIPQENK